VTQLDIRHLQMLLAIDQSASLTAAAMRLNITPSALSHRMREAERRMRGFLFNRTTNSITLTPAGRRLLATAESVIATLERGEKESALIYGGYETVVRIGSRANLCNGWIGGFCETLKTTHPKVAIELVPDSMSAQPFEQMRNGFLDLVIVTGGWDLSDLTAYKLFDDELVGLVSVQHAHATKPFLTGTDFMRDVLVAYSFSIEPNLEYDLMFSKYDGLPASIMSVGTADAVLDLVSRNIGMGVLPRATINEARYASELKLLPLTEHGVFTAWYCAHLPTASQPSFIDLVSVLTKWCGGRKCSHPGRA
jgi:LysR family transcriptional regulator, regulator for metE and metH